jgi:hypothetical protein
MARTPIKKEQIIGENEEKNEGIRVSLALKDHKKQIN